MTGHQVAEVSHQLEALPLLWVALQRPKERAYYWLALAYTVSWVADWGWHAGLPQLVVSASYPVLQAAIVGFVFLGRWHSEQFLALLVCVALAALILFPGDTLALRTVAWLGLCAIVLDLPKSPLRTALLVTFGGGWAGWVAYTFAPSAAAWIAYRLTWLTGEGLFCWAVCRPSPTLELV